MAALRSIDNENSAVSRRPRTPIILGLDDAGAAMCPRCHVAGTTWLSVGTALKSSLEAGDDLTLEPA